MRLSAIAALALLSAGCMLPHPPPPPPPPELAATSLSFDPASADPFLGAYRSGGDLLTIRRDGAQLFAQRAGEPPYALTRTSQRAFVDARGIAYVFTPQGAGGGVTLQMVYADGQFRVWNRSG